MTITQIAQHLDAQAAALASLGQVIAFDEGEGWGIADRTLRSKSGLPFVEPITSADLYSALLKEEGE